MGHLDFLRQNGGRRLRQGVEQPPLDGAGDEEPAPQVVLDFETAAADWRPRPVTAPAIDPAALPRRFIDGCHAGETVAWLRDAEHHPIPVRLAEIGSVCLRVDGRSLRREAARVERVVCLVTDPFPPDDIARFAAALAEAGMRLLPSPPPRIDRHTRGLTYDYERMRQQTYNRSQQEMRALEEQALALDAEALSLVDGRLGRIEHPRAVGVVKQHRENYLHPAGWQVFYDLEPGQRTPAFRLPGQGGDLVSWYLKLDGAHGALPNWGVVRVEISAAHFEQQGRDFGYLDRLSNALLHLRCRQGSYARAAVSLEPIVRGEESLKALLTAPATLAQRFYRLTGL